MKTVTIALDVDENLAEAYENASSEDKQKAQIWFELLLRQWSSGSGESLSETMDRISKNAQERGLTPEILEELLEDD